MRWRALVGRLKNPKSVVPFLLDPKRLSVRLRRKDSEELAEFFPRLLGVDADAFHRHAREAVGHFDTREDVLDHFKRVRGRELEFEPWQTYLYAMVRMRKPQSIVETGVFDGHSSAMLLAGLKANGTGKLYSIDLPAVEQSIDGSTHAMIDTKLPPGCDPGWLVPDDLRGSWELIFADAKQQLPPLLERVGSVNVFLHDSLHTYEHMLWEFQTAWPRLQEGDILLSDDIGWNDAFFEFALGAQRPYGHDFRTGVIAK